MIVLPLKSGKKILIGTGCISIYPKSKRSSKIKSLIFGFLLLILASSFLFFNNGMVDSQSSNNELILPSNNDVTLIELSNEVSQLKTDIDLKSYSISSNHYFSEPITLFIDENAFIPSYAGSIQKIDFYDSTDSEKNAYLGCSSWNVKERRWELVVNFDEPGIKAITADIITTEGYTTQTSSLLQINDGDLETKGIVDDYYSAMFGTDSVFELGYEGWSGHFEDRQREVWLIWEAEIEIDVQLHEITKAYYESSSGKWYPTKESTIKLSVEAHRHHGIIYHDSIYNLIKFQVSDIVADDYINWGRNWYRWFGDTNDDYVYMHNKNPIFDGSYCIGMEMDIDLDMTAWTDDGKSWSNGGYDYRLLTFGFEAQAVDATVIATAVAKDYFLQVYDRDSPTMNGPVIDDIQYSDGGLRVTTPEFFKYSVRFRADFTPIDGIPGSGTHEYHWRFGTGSWTTWLPITTDYCYSPYYDRSSISGSSMVMVEIRDTYFHNARNYGEIFRWDYTGSYSNVNYDNLVKSTSSSLSDIAIGTLGLSQDYANPTDGSGCGVDRSEDIWKYKDINNVWQTIGMGSGVIAWNVNNLPDTDPGHQLSYYTEDRLGNGRTNTAIWVKTNNKVPAIQQGSTHFSGAYTVGETTYVHESTDWTVAAFDNVGVGERDDEIQSMYVRIWTDAPFPFSDVIHYEGTVTGFTYAYTVGGHKVYTLTLSDIFDLPTLAGIHGVLFYLDFKFYDGLGAESNFMRYGTELKMDYSAEHHDATLELSNVSPTYTDESITYISGTTRLSVTNQDPDIIQYEWFADSTSLGSTSTSYYDLDSETLVDGQDYNFKVKATDYFSNTFTTAATQQYTVDNTIPDVNITSLSDYDLLKGEVSLEWMTEFTDINDAYWQYRYWDGSSWLEWVNITDSDSDYTNPLIWDTIALPEYSTYEIRILVIDHVSLTGIDVVGQITIDNVNPVILETPENIIYELGSTGNNLLFNVSDLNPTIYSVYRDDVFLFNESWTSDELLEIDIDGLEVENYTYYLVIYDEFDNSIETSEITVTVEDTTSPVVTEPNDVSYVIGSTGNIIKWTATDLKPWIYSIYLDDVHQFDHAWTSGELIELNVDGLSVGIYTYQIEFHDLHGNWFNDTVIVIVLDDETAPQLIEQLDIIYEFGDSGYEISWSAGDINPDIYNVYLDGDLIDTDTWSNETTITVSLDGYDIGTYLFRIEFYDLFDNMAYDEVIVFIEDTTNPELVGPADITYEEKSTGNILNWNATDLNPDYYSLYINGTLNETGLWINTESIIFNIDGLSQGIYNYTLVVYDTSGNYVSDTVIVTITATLTSSTPIYTIVIALLSIPVILFIKRKKR
ncbi:MAG: hypothetical protein FK733_12490 [Asgard group archaeon]|nr:hypothetical protein [Asgard group archaeon]